MAKIIYKDAAKDITIEQCINLNRWGVSVSFQDGKDAVFDTDLE